MKRRYVAGLVLLLGTALSYTGFKNYNHLQNQDFSPPKTRIQSEVVKESLERHLQIALQDVEPAERAIKGKAYLEYLRDNCHKLKQEGEKTQLEPIMNEDNRKIFEDHGLKNINEGVKVLLFTTYNCRPCEAWKRINLESTEGYPQIRLQSVHNSSIKLREIFDENFYSYPQIFILNEGKVLANIKGFPSIESDYRQVTEGQILAACIAGCLKN